MVLQLGIGSHELHHLLFLVLLHLAVAITSASSLSRKVDADSMRLLETEMLHRMGLQHRPSHSKPIVSDYMLHLFKYLSKHPDADNVQWLVGGKMRNLGAVHTVMSHPLYDSSTTSHGQHRLFFNISLNWSTIVKPRDRNEAEFLAAELRLKRGGLSSSEWHRLAAVWRVPHYVEVHEVVQEHDTNPVTQLIDSKIIDVRHRGWLSLDLTNMANRWKLTRMASQRGGPLLVKLKTQDGRASPIPHLQMAQHNSLNRLRRDAPTQGAEVQWTPQYLTFQGLKGKRARVRHQRKKKRRSPKLKRTHAASVSYLKIKPDLNQLCELRSMYVDFGEVGWSSWIVAPTGYNAGMCTGRCPYPLSDHYNATNHAIVQMIVNSMNMNAAPAPCCVPIQLGRLALLHLGANKEVLYKKYDSMIASSCGCR